MFKTSTTTPAEAFQRSVVAGYIQVSGYSNATRPEVLFPPAKINDLLSSVVNSANKTITVKWTAVGEYLDKGAGLAIINRIINIIINIVINIIINKIINIIINIVINIIINKIIKPCIKSIYSWFSTKQQTLKHNTNYIACRYS